MSFDLILGTTSRNWERNTKTPATMSGTGDKIALGGMVLGVAAGLATIAWLWWSIDPIADRSARNADEGNKHGRPAVPKRGKPYHHTDYTGKRLRVSP